MKIWYSSASKISRQYGSILLKILLSFCTKNGHKFLIICVCIDDDLIVGGGSKWLVVAAAKKPKKLLVKGEEMNVKKEIYSKVKM